MLTLADDPQAVEPPVVKRFAAKRLGEGLTSFRYMNQDASRHLLACARYAWRVDEHGADVVMWTATEDIARILRSTQDLEQLAHSLAIYDP
jgi:exopolyphosphatase/pppGpp-phosphohydrolase